MGLFSLTACTDAEFKRNTRVFSKASIKCYSAGTLMIDDVSTGKVEFNNESGGGFYYNSAKTNQLVQIVRSDCIVSSGNVDVVNKTE